jgi:hypothetical protein
MFVKLTKGNKTFSYLLYHLKIYISLQSQKQFTAQINIDAYFFLLPPDAADDQGDETVKKKSKGKGTRLANVILASKKMTKKKTNSVSLFDGTDWMDEEMKDR